MIAALPEVVKSGSIRYHGHMNQELTELLEDTMDRIYQAKRGRKGGLSWWASRTPEEREESVRRLSEARSRKAAERRKAKQAAGIDMEPPHKYDEGT